MCVPLLLLAGCHDPRRLPANDASLTGCGDGITVEDPADPNVSEQCDDGDQTGTSDSLCTLECKNARVEWVPLEGQTTLPFPARKLVAVAAQLVVSAFDDRGIAVVPVGNAAGSVILKKYSAPVSFEVQDDKIIWIERGIPGMGGPWLLWTRLGDLSVINEITYPRPDSSAGIFVLADNVGPNGFIVHDENGHLHRVMLWNPEQPVIQDYDVGPTESREVTLGRRLAHTSNRVAYFLEAGEQTEVLVTDDYPLPPQRHWYGIWPKKVLHAVDGYFKGPFADEQVAMLAPDGAVDVWSFQGPLSEITDSLFGYVPAGSQQIMRDDSASVYSIDSAGNLVVLKNNGAGRSLRAQQFPIGPPCSICTIAETVGAPEWFALDLVAVHGIALEVE